MFAIHLVQAPWLWGMSPIDNAPSGMLPHINCSTRKQHQQLWRIITGRKKSTGWLCVRATHGGAHCGSFPTERATRAGKSTIYTVIPHRASLRWEFRILVCFISKCRYVYLVPGIIGMFVPDGTRERNLEFSQIRKLSRFKTPGKGTGKGL